MTCRKCRGEHFQREIGMYHYVECGLPNIYLRDMELLSCSQCGSQRVRIPAIEGLHRAIAEMLASSASPLSGLEVRFLRKWLDWSGKDLAARVEVRPETVSRWENGHEPVPAAVQSIVRVAALLSLPNRQKYLDQIQNLLAAREHSQPRDRVLHRENEVWHEEAELAS